VQTNATAAPMTDDPQATEGETEKVPINSARATPSSGVLSSSLCAQRTKVQENNKALTDLLLQVVGAENCEQSFCVLACFVFWFSEKFLAGAQISVQNPGALFVCTQPTPNSRLPVQQPAETVETAVTSRNVSQRVATSGSISQRLAISRNVSQLLAATRNYSLLINGRE